MRTLLLACCAAAVALAAGPVAAQQYTTHGACAQWRHGRCMSWHPMAHGEKRAAGYDVGYDFGPNYSYIDIGALPQPVVNRYHLGPNFRYVNENGRVYVVNPHTYRVIRVIQVP